MLKQVGRYILGRQKQLHVILQVFSSAHLSMIDIKSRYTYILCQDFVLQLWKLSYLFIPTYFIMILSLSHLINSLFNLYVATRQSQIFIQGDKKPGRVHGDNVDSRYVDRGSRTGRAGKDIRKKDNKPLMMFLFNFLIIFTSYKIINIIINNKS